MIRYIQRKQGNQLETVDQVEIRSRDCIGYLKQILSEYRISDPSAIYYSSSRSCKDHKK